MVEGLKKSPLAFEEIMQAHAEIQQGLDLTKQSSKMAFRGYTIPTKDFIKTCYTLLSNKNATANDIPMLLNTRFYEEARQKRGALTPQEIHKAEVYFEALESHPIAALGDVLPKSKYHQNILEKEGFDTMPWYARF
jgi:hypothetical protein